MTQLTSNFTLAQLTVSETAKKYGINNSPDSKLAENNLRVLCQNILEPIRARLGIPVIHSAYRSRALNNAVPGSSRTSQHCLGEAVDFHIAGRRNYDVASWIAENMAFDQLILENVRPGQPHSGWVHVSYRAGRLRGKINTKVYGISGYKEGLIQPK